MFELKPGSEGNVIGLKATGKLVDADYKELIPKFDAKIEEVGKVNVLFDMTELEGWSCKAMLDDAEFGIKHRKEIGKIALLGNKKWEKDAVVLAKPFYGEKMKFFDESDEQAAWDWLKE